MGSLTTASESQDQLTYTVAPPACPSTIDLALAGEVPKYRPARAPITRVLLQPALQEKCKRLQEKCKRLQKSGNAGWAFLPGTRQAVIHPQSR